MLLQPTTFFFLMLPEFPAVAVVPAFLSLVLVQLTLLVALMVVHGATVIVVVAVDVPIARAGQLR